MAFFRSLSIALCLMSTLLLVVGLYKPWWVLWWEDTQNRLKVIKVYGLGGVLFLALYYLVGLFITLS